MTSTDSSFDFDGGSLTSDTNGNIATPSGLNVPDDLIVSSYKSIIPKDVNYSNNLELKKAASEALLAGAFLLADVARQVENWDRTTSQAKQSEVRFREALEALKVALGK